MASLRSCADFSTGGQRVKVCLAACTWQRPHLIILDEPTNYLDRDSLGALSKSLKDFEGGVVIISHSSEFTEHITEEVWAVLDGRMTPSGHSKSYHPFVDESR